MNIICQALLNQKVNAIIAKNITPKIILYYVGNERQNDVYRNNSSLLRALFKKFYVLNVYR